MSEQDAAIGYYAPDRRPFIDRIIARLGFGEPRAPRPSDEDGERFAPGYLATVTRVRLDWSDRLRVLISGKIAVEAVTLTDVTVGRAQTTSEFRVLSPRAPVVLPQSNFSEAAEVRYCNVCGCGPIGPAGLVSCSRFGCPEVRHQEDEGRS